MMKHKDFAVFIITHERVNNQKTFDLLKKSGYTGEIFFIIDDKDEQIDEYKNKYGDKVIVFSKDEIKNKIDTMTNKKEYLSSVYVRNEVYNIAKKLKLKFIFVCDDDIKTFHYRYIEDGKLKQKKLKNIDDVFDIMCETMEKSKVIAFGFTQKKYYIGGLNQYFKNGHVRMLAHTMLLKVEEPIDFRGIFYEDTISTIKENITGRVCLTTTDIMSDAEQFAVGSLKSGGMTEIYKRTNLYTHCFFYCNSTS